MQSTMITTALLLATTVSLACRGTMQDNEETAMADGGADPQSRVKHVPHDRDAGGGARWTDSPGIWNLPYDFYASPPPAGITPDWRFGWKDSVSGVFNPFTNTGFSPARYGQQVPYWNNPANESTIWRNTSRDEMYWVRPGQLSLHPGSRGQYATARWVADRAMRASVWAKFGQGASGPVGYRIIHNTASGSIRALWYSPPANVDAEYFGRVDLQVGDSIDFMVGEGFDNGNTPVDIEITALRGTDYAATNSFRIGVNPIDHFTYGWRQTPTSEFAAYSVWSDSLNGWTTGSYEKPNLNGPKAWNPRSEADPMLPSKSIALFPGNGSEYSSVIFTAPFNGIRLLDVTVYRGTGDWCTVKYVVKVNGVIVTQSEVPDESVTKAFYGDVMVHQGDTIEVLIGNSVPGTGRSAGAAGVEFHLWNR